MKKSQIFLIIILGLILTIVAVWTLVGKQKTTPDPINASPTVSYINSSTDLITVTTPTPGARTKNIFTITGNARGTWFFEASFPIIVLDKNGNLLASTIAQAKDDWMTENFVPFDATISIPETYSGSVIVVLKKDNPSDDRSRDASVSFPLVIGN